MAARPPLYPLLVRLSPEARRLLDRASADQRRSRASLIDEAVRAALATRYADVTDRLTQMLGR
jgi:uncharacterized protein (DUF1778 family)